MIRELRFIIYSYHVHLCYATVLNPKHGSRKVSKFAFYVELRQKHIQMLELPLWTPQHRHQPWAPVRATAGPSGSHRSGNPPGWRDAHRASRDIICGALWQPMVWRTAKPVCHTQLSQPRLTHCCKCLCFQGKKLLLPALSSQKQEMLHESPPTPQILFLFQEKHRPRHLWLRLMNCRFVAQSTAPSSECCSHIQIT